MTSTNTTIYGLDDRYRGVKGGLRVLFINPDDVGALGFVDGDRVDLISGIGQSPTGRCKSGGPRTFGWCLIRRRAETSLPTIRRPIR